MSVYVDELADMGLLMKGRRVKTCHLFADSVKELLAFAVSVKLPVSWAQNLGDPEKLPHFDIVLSKRVLAVKLGAIEVTRKRAVQIWRWIRAERERLTTEARRRGGRS